MVAFSIELVNGDRIARRANTRRLTGAAARSWINRSQKVIASRARFHAPRDEGKIRRGIRTSRARGWPATGGVRATAPASAFVHGALGQRQLRGRRTRPHWVPRAALRPWARRHGIPVYLAARAISRRGTPIVPFLALAVRDNRHRLNEFLRRASRDVEGEWRGR